MPAVECVCAGCCTEEKWNARPVLTLTRSSTASTSATIILVFRAWDAGAFPCKGSPSVICRVPLDKDPFLLGEYKDSKIGSNETGRSMPAVIVCQNSSTVANRAVLRVDIAREMASDILAGTVVTT